jgi:histidine triad (HIT) family protein
MDDCIFCKIAAGEVPAKIVYRDDNVVAIEDLNPQAPAHLLVIPRDHFPSLVESIGDGGDALTAALFSVAARLGREHGGAGGFRLVVNTGPDGGQTVAHVHVHVLAGRPMAWPPG